MNTFKRKALFTAVLAGIALAGCESMAPQISPTTLAPTPPAKDANVTCVTYDTIAVDVGLMQVNVDKGVVESGELDVQCGSNKVKFTNTKAAKP